jgi:ornithine carbamoyltransferase
VRSLLSLSELQPDQVEWLISRSVEFAKEGAKASALHDDFAVGLYFNGPSSRTRTAFWRASTLLGADVIAYGKDELQLSTGETRSDTGRVLSSYVDCLVVRDSGDLDDLRELSSEGRLGVVNALSRLEHPTQAVCDMAAILEEFGSLTNIHVAYVGEGNSTASALALAVMQTPGCRLSLVTPPGYGLPTEIKLRAEATSAGRVSEFSEPEMVSGSVDVVYASRWRTMGLDKGAKGWQGLFAGYCLNGNMLERLHAQDARIMHDLPAVRDEDIASSLLDGASSIAWRQAEFKMFSAMAIIEWVMLSKVAR